METKRTDKDILLKGIKMLLLTALLMFVGPTLLYIGFSDKLSQIFSIATIVLGFVACAGAVYLGFKGLKTIMKSMFD